MTKAILLTICLMLAGCASESPRVIQSTGTMEEIHLTGGMATQVEMPEGMRVQSVVVGNPALVTADRAVGVVNLVPKEGVNGQTNMIVRAADDSNEVEIYQYKLTVQTP